MKSSIVPLSHVEPALLHGFLQARGFARAYVDWKYFDTDFSAGRERGWVWYKDGAVRGFIGMIPVTLATPGGDREMVWTCDWFVEDHAGNPGIGIKLLRRVQDSHDFTCGVGGSEDTHAILPRMNTCTVRDTAVFLHRPLRLMPLLEKVEQRFGFLPKLSRTPLGQLRLSRGSGGSVRFSDGVAAAIGPLFDRAAERECRVRYDLRHLAWIARCPGMRVLSATIGNLDAPEAGALIWCQEHDPRYWRIALRCVSGRGPALTHLADGIAARLAAEGGALVTTIISHLDTEALKVLKRSRFLEGSQRWPMYIPLKTEPGSCQQGFADMSYLDTDLAVNF